MTNPTALSKLLLLTLIALSLGIFVVQMSRLWGRIASARPDAEFELRPIAPRLWRVFCEVVFQTKVIRSRAWVGLAHAFLFWAFCLFSVEVLNHLASGFGHPFLDRTTRFGAITSTAVLWFSAFGTLCVTCLIIRRFIFRPEWLDPLTLRSGLLSITTLVLLATYLAESRVPEQSSFFVPLWWVRTIALLAVIPLLSYGKQLHALLSPLTLFCQPEELSRLPVPDPESKGLLAGPDITRLTALQAYSCVECGRCTEHCPAWDAGKELDPRLIPLGIGYYLDEFGTQSTVPILETAVPKIVPFQCTTCGACDTVCPVGIQPMPMILELRRGAIMSGGAQDPHAAELFYNVEQYGNSLGVDPAERSQFIHRERLPIFDGSQEYCLWLGCMGSYEPQTRDVIVAFAKVMDFLGTTFGVLSKEYCTGDAVQRLGNSPLFSQLAAANLTLLREQHVRKIVSVCPHCVRTMAEDWNHAGLPDDGAPETEALIEHHTEFLARHAKQLPKSPSDHSTTFHDPCYLGRYRGIYDEPRQIIRHWSQIKEPPRTRECSSCCGAGGGLAFLSPEHGQPISMNRAKELASTGAQTVATACPFCKSSFHHALPLVTTDRPRLLDVAEIAAARLPSKRML